MCLIFKSQGPLLLFWRSNSRQSAFLPTLREESYTGPKYFLFLQNLEALRTSVYAAVDFTGRVFLVSRAQIPTKGCSGSNGIMTTSEESLSDRRQSRLWK